MSVCNACNVMLPDGEALKVHYKSDFHAVNLQRRAQDVAPIKYKDFVAYKAAEAEAAEAAKAASAPAIYICDACSKRFTSEGQFEAHMKSKKHVTTVREILAAQREEAAKAKAASGSSEQANDSNEGDDGAVEEDNNTPVGDDSATAEEELIVDHRHCIFCFHESADVDANFAHMRSEHSFVPPDAECLSDKEGYVIFLLIRVIEGRCLFCTGAKVFESPIATQQHMTAKGHCRVRYEEEEELEAFSEFYEYPDEDEDDEALVEYREPSIDSAGDMVLGNGKVARHRALMRYYKQRFRSGDVRESVQLGRAAAYNRLLIAAGMEPLGASSSSSSSSSRALSIAQQVALSTGTRGNAVDVRAQRADASYWSRFQLRTGVNFNDIRRKHFRVAATGEGH